MTRRAMLGLLAVGVADGRAQESEGNSRAG